MLPAEEIAKLQSVSEVAARVGRGRVCVHNWINKGVLIHGQRVKLSAHRIGGIVAIHPDQLAAFFAATNPDASNQQQPESPAALARRGRLAKQRTAELIRNL